jgi:hypothetical protein
MTAPRLIALRKSGRGYRWRFPDGRANPHVLSCAGATLAATILLGGTWRDLTDLPSKVVHHQAAVTWRK